MAQQAENRTIGDVVELLKENGFAGLAEAVTVLMNNAMRSERSEYLRAKDFEVGFDRLDGNLNGQIHESSVREERKSQPAVFLADLGRNRCCKGVNQRDLAVRGV